LGLVPNLHQKQEAEGGRDYPKINRQLPSLDGWS